MYKEGYKFKLMEGNSVENGLLAISGGNIIGYSISQIRYDIGALRTPMCPVSKAIAPLDQVVNTAV